MTTSLPENPSPLRSSMIDGTRLRQLAPNDAGHLFAHRAVQVFIADSLTGGV